MSWVLLVVVVGGGGITQVPGFSSQHLCEQAALFTEQVVAQRGARRVITHCVEVR